VLDLTHVLNGPFCTMLLATMGADVIKVEQKEGDRYRRAWMPVNATHDGYGFLSVNSNKRGITLNLKSKRGKALFLDLLKQSDVLVENFSPGTMDRLGLGPDVLFETKPDLIYARSSGYGYYGPYTHVRSNASCNLAMSGWQVAQEQMAEKEQIKALGIGDQAGGVSMALGICAALFERATSGKGQLIEISMQEALMGFMTEVFHSHFEGRTVGQPPKQCADGEYAFHLPDTPDDLWNELTAALGEPEAATDPRFSTRKARRENYKDVEALVSKWVRERTRAELWAALSQVGLSSAPVLSLGEVIEDPHIKEREAFVTLPHPTAGEVTLLAPWVRFSRTPAKIERTAPLIGQHNREVFGDVLGLPASEIDELAEAGVI
jgi:crotonobetainyl-CoA:carnitine CoA-transferase CaiB-like acyl-CoA transferase